MHEHNLYDPQAPDMKLIPLIRSLRKGTQIEECTPRFARDFQNKTMERIAYLTEDMLRKGILMKEDNTPKKRPLFNDLWTHRHGRYGPRTSLSKPLPPVQSRDIYSIDNLPPDTPPKAPIATMVTKAAQSSSSALVSKIMFNDPA